MKIKQIPEDFVVEEIPAIHLKKKGKFSVYKLKKTNMDLIASRRTIAKKLKISQKLISHAGIKDKIAVTTQYVAIKTDRGRKGSFILRTISLEHVGFIDQPLKSGDLEGNKFTITIRDMTDEEIKKVKANMEKLIRNGFANYFDSQRFGEDLSIGGFIAKRLMKNDYENALRLFLASANNKSEDKNKAHAFMHKNWTKWDKCSEFLATIERVDEEKRIIHFLQQNPKSFMQAFKHIHHQKKELLVSSYQSFLWNKCLSQLIKNNLTDLLELEYKPGKLFFYKDITKEKLEYMNAKEIPMVDTKTQIKDKEINEILAKILEKENITQKELKVNKMGNLFFKERKRDVIIFPEDLKVVGEQEDTLNPGKKALTISFSLKKGAYATLVTKLLEKL